MSLTRRSVLQAAALAAVSGATRPFTAAAADANRQDAQFHGLRVGVASYSLRAFPFDQALQDIKRLGVSYVSLKDVHLPLSTTAEQRQEARLKIQEAGLTITSCGVLYVEDENQMRQAFDYVRDLGAPLAVVGIHRSGLPALDKVIRNYEIKAAIHNHGPNDKRFPSPLEVYEAVQGLDRRIGLCMDIGHTFRMHENLISDVQKTKDRLYSMHFKDLDSDRVNAKGVPVGMGVLPIVGLLRELLRIGYSGETQLEYEVESKDPLPGMAESFGFMRGSLQAMA